MTEQELTEQIAQLINKYNRETKNTVETIDLSYPTWQDLTGKPNKIYELHVGIRYALGKVV